MLLTTRLQSEKPRNSPPLPFPLSNPPSTFLRELDVFSTNNYFKFGDKKKRNLGPPPPSPLPNSDPKKNGVSYLKSSLMGNSFHFLLLQGLYGGSIKDSVH